MAPSIDEAPAKCIDKIAKSTDGPAWERTPESGGYNVQPVPAASKNIELVSRYRDQGKNQKLKLFKRGKAISGAPIKIGTNQFPNPPIKIGITIKKIMIKPCEVTTALYMWALPLKKKSTFMTKFDTNYYRQ
jgi:hypothetical protein